jgi:hypothetical protein
MKRISEILPVLSGIPGALRPFPPEESHQGEEDGVSRRLWTPDGEADNATLDPHAEMESEEVSASPPEELWEYGAPIDQEAIKRVFGGKHGKQVLQSRLVRGVDGLAWYISFHYQGIQPGIYVPTSSIQLLALQVFEKLPVSIETKLRIAFRVLHQHELTHFAWDYFAAQWECITGKPCYLPARRLKHSRLGYNVLEEQVANIQMIRSFWGGRSSLKAKGRIDALKDFVCLMPPGYKDAVNRTHNDLFGYDIRQLAKNYVDCIQGFDQSTLEGVDHEDMSHVRPIIDWRYCPLHLIDDSQRWGVPPLDLELFRAISITGESDKFKKALERAGSAVAKAWLKAKLQLSQTVALRGLDFKRWTASAHASPLYSIRLSDNYRAHLEFQPPDNWIAIDVGPHGRMGHG